MVSSWWNSLMEFLSSRAWNLYPFIPPITSLLLSRLVIPSYENVLNAKLRDFLNRAIQSDDYQKISALLTSRGLQIAYLTEIPAFLVAVFATVEARHPKILQLSIGAMFVMYLLIFPKLFMRCEPDYVATEIPSWSKHLRAKGFTYLSIYSALLSAL